jgi:hypothetical protein
MKLGYLDYRTSKAKPTIYQLYGTVYEIRAQSFAETSWLIVKLTMCREI